MRHSPIALDERLLYVSRAAPGITQATAFDIVRVAHNRNARDGLTGALLLADGYFLQALEGPTMALRRRFEVIRHDPRHLDITVRSHTPAHTLAFAQTWMALRMDDALTDEIRQRFGYLPGLPAHRFDADQLLGLLTACCAQQTASDALG